MAPVAVFAFNRPAHLRRTLNSLTACEGFEESSVTVYIDGARTAEEKETIAEVRSVAEGILGTKANIRSSSTNLGLSTSISSGVKERLDKYGRVIVIEDDFDLAPKFLCYMNEALNRYADDPQVLQISGHMFEVPKFAGRNAAMFLPMTTTWGWATWARAWQYYDPQCRGWQRLRTDSTLRRQFNLGGVYDFATMLENQMNGRRDSWGIRWYYSVFSQNGLCLFPPQTLVQNIGQDGSGTHGGGITANFTNGRKIAQNITPIMPERTAMSDSDFAEVRSAIWKQNGRWMGFLVTILRSWLGK